MRLGAYQCALAPKSLAQKAYGAAEIFERHRHRYEVNNQYRDLFKEKGLVVSGVNQERDLIEIIELPERVHPWFVGVQFHPEFQSRPLRPHPLFKDFIGACVKKK